MRKRLPRLLSDVNKSLANLEPSTHGPFRRSLQIANALAKYGFGSIGASSGLSNAAGLSDLQKGLDVFQAAAHLLMVPSTVFDLNGTFDSIVRCGVWCSAADCVGYTSGDLRRECWLGRAPKRAGSGPAKWAFGTDNRPPTRETNRQAGASGTSRTT
jgi:hypothetical protein